LKHRGTEVADENDLLAISSNSGDIRVGPRLGLACFSDVGDDARCRRFLERFDGLNGHSIDFTRLQKSRQAALESCDRRVRQLNGKAQGIHRKTEIQTEDRRSKDRNPVSENP
jgi:hypothetical protein